MSDSNPTPTKRAKSNTKWAPLKGIISPIVTPLLDQDVIDKPGTKRLIDHLIAGDVAGVFLLGSTGEGPSVSSAAKRVFVEYACEVVAGRVPVLVSVSDASFSETVSLAKFVAELQAKDPSVSYAVVFTPPFYFTMGQEELLRYAQSVVKTIPSELAVLLYNIPFLTKTHWSVDVVCRLLAWDEQHNLNQIVGMKDSSGDMTYFEQLCLNTKKIRPEFTLYMGPEHLLQHAMRLGADGGVNGGSNVLPELFVEMHRAICISSNSEDDRKVQKLQEGIDALQAIYTVTGSTVDQPFSRLISGTKYALVEKKVLNAAFVNQPFTADIDDVKEKRVLRQIHEILVKVNSSLDAAVKE